MEGAQEMNSNVKVLIVDENYNVRRAIKDVLKQLDFRNILQAESFNTALLILKKESIGLILSDWNISDKSGLELLKTIRGEERWKEILFIMLSSEEKKENILEAIKSGVNHYIIKPFTPEILKQRVKTLFQN